MDRFNKAAKNSTILFSICIFLSLKNTFTKSKSLEFSVVRIVCECKLRVFNDLYFIAEHCSSVIYWSPQLALECRKN